MAVTAWSVFIKTHLLLSSTLLSSVLLILTNLCGLAGTVFAFHAPQWAILIVL